MIRNILKNIQMAWYVLWSKSYIVVTDRLGANHIPYIDPLIMEDVLVLSAQRTVLREMRDRLDDMIKEHDLRVKQVSNEVGQRPKGER